MEEENFLTWKRVVWVWGVDDLMGWWEVVFSEFGNEGVSTVWRGKRVNVFIDVVEFFSLGV